ncbi:hypothetical protein [Nisaea sediminum]|uniref:hypothetical protein n=1 Tax=Nisaea sediminum TaxID=2775867 RepID=UPI001865AEC2|nr:hypothetical protein [Nisaea sediminum]
MRAPRLMIAGVTRQNRHGIIASVGRLVTGAGGWIVDHALFSNVAATIRAEIPRPGLTGFGAGLLELGVALDRESAESLSAAAGRPDDDDLVVSLSLTFLHDEPDLKHPVPAVPG